MPKVRAFDLSPLPADAQASLEALGQKIAATRKAQGLSQRDMAAKIGISPQTMLFVEQGRPNVQIGHYARALSALAAGVLSSLAPRVANHYAKQPVATYTTSSNTSRANALRRHLTHHSRQPSPTQDLEFAYDWSNSGMTEDALIRNVVDKGRFHDLAIICKRYGLERVRQIAGEKMKSSSSLRRSLNNIEEGFAKNAFESISTSVRYSDLYDLFILAQTHGYSVAQILDDAVSYGTNNDPEYYKAVLRGEIPLDEDDEGLEPVAVNAPLEEIYSFFDTEISRLEVKEAARIAHGD